MMRVHPIILAVYVGFLLAAALIGAHEVVTVFHRIAENLTAK